MKTARNALALATLALVTADDHQAQAALTCLRVGAGSLGLPEGATLSGPAGLVPERREVWLAVAEAIRLDTVGVSADYDPEAPWHPVEAGAWESVLATLLVRRDWPKIEETAASLQETDPHEEEVYAANHRY